jgi:hypothetical protein
VIVYPDERQDGEPDPGTLVGNQSDPRPLRHQEKTNAIAPRPALVQSAVGALQQPAPVSALLATATPTLTVMGRSCHAKLSVPSEHSATATQRHCRCCPARSRVNSSHRRGDCAVMGPRLRQQRRATCCGAWSRDVAEFVVKSLK